MSPLNLTKKISQLLNQRSVFLLDGIGAVLSLLVTGVLLPNFSEALGLSREVLSSLAYLPFLYAIFSFTCFFAIKTIQPWMLRSIIALNAFYCLISIYFILFFKATTILGQVFLAFEVLIILVVISIEVQVYKQTWPMVLQKNK